MKKDLAGVKKSKLKRYFLATGAILLTLFVLVFVLTAHKPGRYAPLKVEDHNQISPYLTHQLLPTVYNNTQLGEPFEVVITQQGLNDIVARTPQPISFDKVELYDPQVILTPDKIILIAAVRAKPMDLFVTIELNPVINQQGLLTLHIDRVLLGAVNITAMARLIGNKAYSDWLSLTGMEPDNIVAQICRSLLNDEPFEPTFEFGGKSLRISKFEVSDGKITALLTPALDQPARPSATSQPSSASRR
jgi:uncharacterized protein YpmS